MLDGGRAIRAESRRPDGRPGTVDFAHVVVCGGAIQTPALLQRSGLRRSVGRSLAVHPTVKLAARFADEVNVADDVPVHQVKEFAPDLSFGGSASGPGPRRPRPQRLVGPLPDRPIEDWRRPRRLLRGDHQRGPRPVRAVPGLRDPLVTYRLTRRDRALLGRGLARLALLMLEAGATEVYPSYRGAPVVRRRADLATMQATFARRPGERDDRPPVLDRAARRGRPRRRPTASASSAARRNVHVNDASLLPDAPGVNPQASVMAVAIRNARHFVDDHQAGAADDRPHRSTPPDVTIVTGAGGWLGRALVDHLTRPDGPYAPPRPGAGARDVGRRRAALARSHGVEPVVGDVRRPDGLDRAVRRASTAPSTSSTPPASSTRPASTSSRRSTPAARPT